MFKTLTSKFTFFFWFIFIIANIPIYFLGSVYFKDILKTTESEKIALMLRTLTPIIAFNISFNQDERLKQILNSILDENDIKIVALHYTNKDKKIIITKKSFQDREIFIYKDIISDPFSKNNIATITINYSSEHINNLHIKIIKSLFFISIFALVLFFLFFLYFKGELNALKKIASALLIYSDTQRIEPLKLKNKNAEITTIANVATEMMVRISLHVKELQTFNQELKEQVKQKLQTVKKQELILIHQSRQAAMGEMLESIAHQWRQPLNIIGLASANLETQHAFGIVDDENFKEKMNIISLNINYMSDTIDDFRDFLNPAREVKHFSPYSSIQEVFTILEAQLKNNSISYTLNIDKLINFSGVENEFKQVFFILINNSRDAIKSLSEKQQEKEKYILVTSSIQEKRATINIEDNGGGVSKEIINSIFDPYFTTKFASQGTGIGLYIAKNIIETRMQGSIKVENTKDGCCFSIILPINTITNEG